MTLSDFMIWFREDFPLAIEVQQLSREFQDMHQTTRTVAEITAKFRETVLLVLSYAVNGEMENTRYHDLLRSEIREFFFAIQHVRHSRT